MQEIIKQRIKAVTLAMFLVFPCLMVRLFYVQIVSHPYYSQEASRNLDQYRDITPRRGAIYDRNYLLVKTAPQYDILIYPTKVIAASMHHLSELLALPETEIEGRVNRQKKICQQYVEKHMQRYEHLPPNKYARLKRGIERDYYSRLYPFLRNISYENAHKIVFYKKEWLLGSGNKINVSDRYAGFEVDSATARQYPWESRLVNVLGNIGAISEAEYRAREKDYRINDTVGRLGIEAYCEEQLRGRRGCYVDSREGYIFTEPPTDGSDLILTIDAELQSKAEEALDNMLKENSRATGGAAVVVEIGSGDVLVMATSPRTIKDFANPERADENRAIRNYYSPSPGSVFKVMAAAYALQKGIIDKNFTSVCEGVLDKSRPFEFRCDHKEGHGRINIVEAIEGSCNVFFYRLGEKIGAEHLVDCARSFGYGEKTQIELPNEYAGDIPTLEREWEVGVCRMFGIGQIFSATPLQVARAIAMFANKGQMPTLRLIRECRAPRQKIFTQPEEENGDEDNSVIQVAEIIKKPSLSKTWPLAHEHWETVTEGMRLVTEGQHGTANDMRKLLGNIRIASKTGTAQIAGPYTFYFIDFKNNMVPFLLRLREAKDATGDALGFYVKSMLTQELQNKISADHEQTPPPLSLKEELRTQLNKILRKPLYNEKLFAPVLRSELQKLSPYLALYARLDNMPSQECDRLSRDMRKLYDKYRSIVRLNHALLDDAFPKELEMQVSREKRDARENHAWFAGFAPLYAPRYAFAVFVEHGGFGGKVAAPVAVEIVKKIFAMEQERERQKE
jgi:penicillin-binding protein 2